MLNNYNKHDRKDKMIPFMGGNGPPCPSLGSTSLRNGNFGSMEEWRRGRVNGLRGKWSQGTHTGNITIGREGVF